MGTLPVHGVVAGDLTVMPPWSMAGMGRARALSACPLNTLPFQNTCHVLNFVDCGVLKFNFAAVTFLFKAPSSPLESRGV